ncbi:Thioredoxin-like 1-1 chloroplastic [Zea mays]|uniref:Thioredoxin-like 1-1 chloroplastic n=1 Tax=Zea mays TaxID=4577 RepID=A0A1D6INR2_MAIZE|nr:Thioredoxin-like 1-1 chloroplastic [Zea mays]
MADALCNGVVASPCGRDVAGRARGAARAALAESLQVAGHASKTSFSAGRMSVKDSKPRPLSRSLEAAAPGQMNLSFPKAMRWWKKGLHPNMREVESAQDLADSLLSAGDKLVVVDFFSPGCGGCRALHPKIAQFAEKNPGVQFLQGLDESELMALAENRDLHFTYDKPGGLVPLAEAIAKEAAAPGGPWLPLPASLLGQGSDNSLLPSGR